MLINNTGMKDKDYDLISVGIGSLTLQNVLLNSSYKGYKANLIFLKAIMLYNRI